MALNIVCADQAMRKSGRTDRFGFPRPHHLSPLTPLMPKPKGKAGPSKGYNKYFKRRPTTKPTYDHVPESAIDRKPDVEEPEDEDSACSRIKIDVPVAMWVCETTPHAMSFGVYYKTLGLWSLRPKTLLGEETRSAGTNKGDSSGEPIPWDRTIVRLSFPDMGKALDQARAQA